MKGRRLHLLVALLISVGTALALQGPPAVLQVAATTYESVVLADFERGVDPRGLLYDTDGNDPTSMSITAPQYGNEQPPTLRGDDWNWWSVTSDIDNSTNEYADYIFTLGSPTPTSLTWPPDPDRTQDWTPFTQLQINISAECTGNCSSLLYLIIYPHDADGTGNAGTNGYHIYDNQYVGGWFGPSSPLLLDLTTMPNRDQVDHFIIRAVERNFADSATSSATLTLKLSNISLSGPGIQPAATYWPLPPLDTSPSVAYWWSYQWHNGKATVCPGEVTPNSVLTAQYRNDGAFGDTVDNPNDLIAISFFKSDPCAYYLPGKDHTTIGNRTMRWYSRGYQVSNTPFYDMARSGNVSTRMLSFKGASEWVPDRTKNVNLLRGTTVVTSVNGTDDYINDTATFTGGIRYSYLGGDDNQAPNYSVLPDRPLNANLVMSQVTRPLLTPMLNDPAQYWRYRRHITTNDPQSWKNEWERMKTAYDTNPPDLGDPDNPSRWTMYSRETSYIYTDPQGGTHPVLYVGFNESRDSDTESQNRAVCEEWWFAKDVGPIYIAVYSPAFVSNENEWWTTFRECESLLAGTTGNVNDPEGTLNHVYRQRYLVGYLKLTDYCIGTDCKAEY